MRKVVALFILATIFSGCAGSRRAGKTGSVKNNAPASVNLTDISGQNLTAGNFFIGKADVEINSMGQSQKFVATIKYEVPGRYLISIRSRAGIEAGRIYIDRDTILGNDRINRVLYYGEPDALTFRYGIPFELIPVIFGDFISENRNAANMMCQNGSFEIEESVRGSRMIYEIDCREKKIALAENLGSYNNLISELQYESFVKIDDIAIPSHVRINHVVSGTSVSITFDKIERPWNGTIEFVPGNRYERVELK